MDKIELLDLIAKGESSFVEFKADTPDIKAETIAEYVVCFANSKGGTILLGVEDDGTITGLKGRFSEYGTWISDAVQGWVHPNIIVDYEEVPVEENLRVAVIMVPMGVAKPYSKRKGKDAKERYYIRDVTRCREADREELRRLFQSSGVIHFEMTPVPRSRPDDLNDTLLIEYFRQVRNIGYDDKSKWLRLLLDNQILSEELGDVNCTLAGLILFGKKDRVKKLIPQSGITAVEYDTSDADVAGRFRREINGPLLSLRSDTGEIIEEGIIDQAVDFILRVKSKAVAHRDYTIGGTNIGLWLYPDRLEIDSPGNLPNTITIERMKSGARYHRNQMIVDYLRDMEYIEGSGRGVSRKIIRGMIEHNGKEPAFELRGEALRVTLYA
ncbi:MAG: putative DNA binding domain-containing protein [Deltaproteobacteria bacterium]|nr:putative DNA binding domain-containing protein [Deltaproteobacteria bacterium]